MAKEKDDKFPYGVDDVAKACKASSELTRIHLRKLNAVKKNGNKYGWATKADLDKIIKAVSDSMSSSKSEAKPAKKAAAKKPAAKKTAAKKPAKKPAKAAATEAQAAA